MFFTRQKKDAFNWRPEYDELATYNAEVIRGIVHTDIFNRRMAALQAQYDVEIKEHAAKNGMLVIET